MNLRVSEVDDLYVPDDALLRSFVGATGRTELSMPVDYEEDAVTDRIRDVVTVRADDGEVGRVDVLEEIDREEGNVVDVVAGWRVAVSIPHTPSWDAERVTSEAADAIDVDQGEITNIEYSYSRPAHEYPTERWREITDEDTEFGGGPDVIEQWVHERLLLVVGLVEMEVEGDDEPLYALVELAPPVPSPYDLARYYAYDQFSVAQTDLKRYMLAVDGAFDAGVSEPVKTARDRFVFHGAEIDSPDANDARIEETEDVDRSPMSSLPNRPLTREEVETVVEGYESIAENGCTLLLPDEPLFVDEIVRRAQHVTEGDHVAFTISMDDKFAVFELEDREEGLRWYRKEGDLDP